MKICRTCKQTKDDAEFYFAHNGQGRLRLDCIECFKEIRNSQAKRLKISGWQYRGDAPYDKQWREDRSALFQENGNGWWWYAGLFGHGRGKLKDFERFKEEH